MKIRRGRERTLRETKKIIRAYYETYYSAIQTQHQCIYVNVKFRRNAFNIYFCIINRRVIDKIKDFSHGMQESVLVSTVRTRAAFI